MGNNCAGCQNTDGCCCCDTSGFIKDFKDHYQQLNTVHDSRCSMVLCII